MNDDDDDDDYDCLSSVSESFSHAMAIFTVGC